MGVFELNLSLGEFEALVAKAARGAGMPWGLAAEAGRAARAAVTAGRDDAPGLFADFLEDNPSPCPLRAGLAERDGHPSPPEADGAWALIRDAAADRLATGNATRCRLSGDAHDALARLAHRTYAPATEESRLKGAG